MMRQRLALLTLAVLWGGYLLQLASPLRTNTDATIFLDLAASASDGAGLQVDGQPTHYPPGYPMLLAALDRAGLACSASFIGVNLLALGLGLASSSFVLKRSLGLSTAAVIVISCLTMLCWVYVKHVTLPLSDLPYFGLATAGLALLTWSPVRPLGPRVLGMGGAVLLVAAAIAVRTVGIALVPAVGFACLPPRAARRLRAPQPPGGRQGGSTVLALAVGVAVAAAAMLSVLIVTRTLYFQWLLERLHGTIGLRTLTHYKLYDWGELVVNTSVAKLPAAFRGLVALAGLLVPLALAAGARRRDRIAAVDLYVATYCAILLVWPYQDARFWIPVLPLLLGYAWLAAERYWHVAAVRWAGCAYLAAFSLLGLLALGYSTWISLGRDRFPERFAGGVYRGSYRAAWSPGRATAGDGSRVDPQIVRLVRRYSRPLD